MGILKKNWKKLHRLIYLISILGVIHFLWLVKKDLTEPLVYLLIIIVLLILRINFNRSKTEIS